MTTENQLFVPAASFRRVALKAPTATTASVRRTEVAPMMSVDINILRENLFLLEFIEIHFLISKK